MVDEATQYYWVFTHKTKDASAEVVMEAINGFQRDDHTVKAIKSDRDPVYMSEKFQKFLSNRSIEHHPTSGYTPQENGRAERGVGVLKATLQSLLSDSGLKDSLWAEAVHHAAYLHNISSSTGATTPWQRITGTKPDASSLRIWGCKAWKLIPADKRSKSADTRKSEQVRFVGIAWPNQKAYRVLTSKGHIETTRQLAFDESAPPACNTRADFTPFEDIEITVETGAEEQSAAPASTSTPIAPQQETSETLPEVSPISDEDSRAAMPEPTISDSEFHLNSPNPLFGIDDDAASPTAVELQPTLQQPSGIPGPRRSSRANKNVPPDRYTEDAFRKYATGLRNKSAHVTLANPAAFLL
jgi:hypothetical protein